MKLSTLVVPDVIAVSDTPLNKPDLLRSMVHRLIGHHCPDGEHPDLESRVLERIVEREERGATVLGRGVACPHALVPGFPGVGIAVARLRTSLDFGAAERVDLVFLVVGNRTRASVMLKVLAEIARLASDRQVVSGLRAQQTPERLAGALKAQFHDIGIDLQAQDVMRDPHVYLTPDLPLTHVVREMLRYNVDAMGIVDGGHRLIGEVTSDLLFKLGLPEFFTQLKSVSFIGDFDPFEKYFENEPGRSVGDVMSADFATVAEDTPILEVIFKLAVQQHAKVYVLRHGVLVGVIDRSRVLEKILSM